MRGVLNGTVPAFYPANSMPCVVLKTPTAAEKNKELINYILTYRNNYD
jgi:hypothetical protein